MIVHVFNGRQIHLVLDISKGFITTYYDIAIPFIVIIGGSEENKNKYLHLFRDNHFNDFIFISSLFQFAKFVMKVKDKTILFHGGLYEWVFVALTCGADNVNWVCWGQGSAIGKNWKSRLMTPVKRVLYQKYKSIVTLMDEDRESIIKDFHVRPDAIQTISYATTGYISPYDNLLDQLFFDVQPLKEKPLVLLGNSPRETNNYIEMLYRLEHLKGKIRVQCMNNYSLKRGKLYNQLIATGKSLFGDDFKSNEDFYSEKPDYFRYMNSCDLYVCTSSSQTGLGAIGTCIRLGKKIYIHGKNLNWMRNHYGVKVWDSDDITNKTTYDELVQPLDINQKKLNRELFLRKRSGNVDLWKEYLQRINIVNSVI